MILIEGTSVETSVLIRRSDLPSTDIMELYTTHGWATLCRTVEVL